MRNTLFTALFGLRPWRHFLELCMQSNPKKKSFPSPQKGFFRKKSFHKVYAPQEILTNPHRPAWFQSSPSDVDLVFFDFETTGGNPNNSSIIEIGAIKYSKGVEVGRFETLVKPQHRISKIVEKITGINEHVVKNAPEFHEIAQSFFEFVGDSILISHGALGDIAFVYHHFKEFSGQELKNFYFCTHLLVSHFFPQIPSKTLTGVAEYFKISAIVAHNAMNDAQLTCEVFWKIKNILDQHGLHQCLDYLKIQADNETLKKLGPGINPDICLSLPTAPGIIYFTNPDQQISFYTATTSIRKIYQQFTSVSQDRELNKIMVHMEGFRFERTSHFLGALLKENEQLKKISLEVDPRRLQSRSEKFLQILLPQDLQTHFSSKISSHASLHEANEEKKESVVSEVLLQDTQNYRSFLNDYVNASSEIHEIEVFKTRKNLVSTHSQRLSFTRDRVNEEGLLEWGHLKSGFGYYFGPFEKPKETAEKVKLLLEDFPIQNNALSLEQRLSNLRVLISYLHGQLENEIETLKGKFFQLPSLKSISQWPLHMASLKKAQKLQQEPSPILAKELYKSGLGVITNNELKELELVVVVKGRIVKKIRMPIEQSSKLKSPRFFTRLFQPYYEEIKNIHLPFHFDDETCSAVELFYYWLEQKKGEGEWVEFGELENLYDPQLLA